VVTPSAKKRAVKHLVEVCHFSVQMACRAMRLNRSSYYYVRKESEFEKNLIKELHFLSKQYPRWGYVQMTRQLKRRGWRVNKKRVQRLWRLEGLKVPVKQVKKRRIGNSTRPRQRALYANHVWSWDFMFDRTDDGRALKILNIVDEYSRFNVYMEVGRNFTGKDVVAALGRAMIEYGIPGCIRSDNGSEFISQYIKDWLIENGIGIQYIDPASPWQNPYVESFNGTMRDECLNRELFETLLEAKVVLSDWRDIYNLQRTHGNINAQTPAEVYGKFVPLALSPIGEKSAGNCNFYGNAQIRH